MSTKYKLIAVITVVLVVSCGIAFSFAANKTADTERAPENVDKVAGVKSSSIAMIMDSYEQILGDLDYSIQEVSSGYRIHYLSMKKTVSVGSNDINDLMAAPDEKDYLYRLYQDGKPTILLVVTDSDDGPVLKGAGGLAGCYAETRALLGTFVSDSEIRIYNYSWANYIMVAKIGGTEYVLPFDEGPHIIEKYKGINDYRELPTLNEFLDAYRAECIKFDEACRADAAAGGSGILYGDIIVWP